MGLDKGLIVLQRRNFFVENCNYTFVGVIVLAVVTLALRSCVREREEEVKKKNEKKKEDKEK